MPPKKKPVKKPKRKIRGGFAGLFSSSVASAPSTAQTMSTTAAMTARALPQDIGPVSLPIQPPTGAWNVASLAQQNLASQSFSTLSPIDRSISYNGGAPRRNRKLKSKSPGAAKSKPGAAKSKKKK